MKTENNNQNPLFHINEYYGTDPLKIGSVDLVQVGRLFCNPDTVIERHAHLGWYELTIVTGGTGTVEANGVIVPVSEGDIFISLPYDTHAIYSDAAKPLKYDFFSFYPRDDEKRATLESLSAAIYPANKRIVNNDKIGYLVATVTEEISSNAPDRIEITESAISQIIIYLIRSIKGISTYHTQHVSDRDMLCFKIMNYIDTHIGTIKNLNDLGDIMNYNYSYLSAIFKSQTGSTICEYFQRKKLEAARQLLIEGKLRISKIAEIFGYSSIYAFSKAFKKKYGIAPSKITALTSTV
jgi:AraC-like DNA-binding protein/quercetin dioxygenase-like cupin family protein